MNKPVQTSENWDWKQNPYRFDPSRGYLLCKPCWNGQHFDPPYRDQFEVWHHKVANCKQGDCHCGCRPEFQERKKRVKFTGEGQTVIDTGDDVIEIK